MQAVILAGGKGTRLRPLTNRLPKPMVLVYGRPFLEHLIIKLREEGISDYVILVGFMSKIIEDYFGDGSELGVRISYSRETKLMGTGGALKEAEDLLEEIFVLVNGDTYFPESVSIFNCGEASTEEMTMIVTRASLSLSGNVDLDANNLVCCYNKDSETSFGYVDAGMYLVGKDVVRDMEAGRTQNLESGLFKALIAKRKLCALVSSQSFYDIGTPESLSAFRNMSR